MKKAKTTTPVSEMHFEERLHNILSNRGQKYGEFRMQAFYSQQLENVLRISPRWEVLLDDQREALKMIQHKVSRILNGDPNYVDSWQDIAGYAQLIVNRLEREKAQSEHTPNRTGSKSNPEGSKHRPQRS